MKQSEIERSVLATTTELTKTESAVVLIEKMEIPILEKSVGYGSHGGGAQYIAITRLE